MIDPATAEDKKSWKNVVVVCPRGGGEAKRCYDSLKEQRGRLSRQERRAQRLLGDTLRPPRGKQNIDEITAR
ncbi:MAG: hypothetical protein BM485_02745 [Desulfobulbaceae bacterium DB1]|nr:MAG: hypothetical protein BM485_02745 [Desulfobulbaceae bacterium DB1]